MCVSDGWLALLFAVPHAAAHFFFQLQEGKTALDLARERDQGAIATRLEEVSSRDNLESLRRVFGAF